MVGKIFRNLPALALGKGRKGTVQHQAGKPGKLLGIDLFLTCQRMLPGTDQVKGLLGQRMDIKLVFGKLLLEKTMVAFRIAQHCQFAFPTGEGLNGLYRSGLGESDVPVGIRCAVLHPRQPLQYRGNGIKIG